jgi:hypothetical protein
MRYRIFFFILLFVAAGNYAMAQKPFAEGTIVYKVKLASAAHKEVTGVYTFTIKGSEIKKELKLNNGYQDIVIMNCGTGTVHSLQNKNGKKYAIQLKMSELVKEQEKFTGFVVKNEKSINKNMAGAAVYEGNINYKDGTAATIYYTKDWRPAQAVTFERFPDAKFFPMNFSYTDVQNMTMVFEIEKLEPGPIENAVFRIPPDYRMISYDEYKELSK